MLRDNLKSPVFSPNQLTIKSEVKMYYYWFSCIHIEIISRIRIKAKNKPDALYYLDEIVKDTREWVFHSREKVYNVYV